MLHADQAVLNPGEDVSIPAGTIETPPPLRLEPGSGRFGTPCERMHTAKLTSEADCPPPLIGGFLEPPHPVIASAQQTPASVN